MAATAASTGYLQLASLSWFLYDWAIRFAEELDFLRARPWSFTRSLYIFIRYITLALLVGETVVSVRVEGLSPTRYDSAAPSPAPTALDNPTAWRRCTTFVSVRTAGTFVILIAVFVAVQSCISKLYNGSGSRARALGRATAALGAVSLMIAVVLEGVFASRNDVVTSHEGSCYTSTQRISAVSWIAPFCFTLYITVLAALKFKATPQADAIFECETLAQLFGVTCLPCLALLPMSLMALVLLRAAAPASHADGGISIVQAAAAICATRLLTMMAATSTRSSTSASATLLEPAHLELGAVRHLHMHRAKDSYWSQQDTLVTALSPRSAVFPSTDISPSADDSVDLASPKKKRFSRQPTPPGARTETVEMDLETEHARTRAALVSAIVTRAEMDFELNPDDDDADGDDDSSFNIVDGDQMKGLSPDADTPPRRFSVNSTSVASLRVPKRNSSRASLGALSLRLDMLAGAGAGEGGPTTPRRASSRASLPVISQDVVNSQPGAG